MAGNSGLKAEQDLMKRLQVLPAEFRPRAVPASGAMKGAKGDLKSTRLLIENKYTDNRSVSIKAGVWEKIEREAIEQGGRVPLLTMQMAGTHRENRLVVMRESDLIGILCGDE